MRTGKVCLFFIIRAYDAQREKLTQHCIAYGYQVVKVYSDEGISGKSTNRPQFQKMIKDCKNGLIDLILVWKISRFSRTQLDLLSTLNELEKYNVGFMSYSEHFDTSTPMGKFALQMMGAVAELERNIIVENVQLGMAQRAKKGKWNGGIIYGYDSIDKHLVINKNEAEIVKQIFSWFIDGLGIQKIRDKLNGMNVKTKKGTVFSNIAVRDIIRNPVYKGFITFQKKTKGVINDNYIIEKGEHEVIVSEEIYAKTNEIMENNKRKTRRGRSGIHILSSILRCPNCGSKMYYHPGSTTGYYCCSDYKSKGTCNFKNYLRADKLEKEVIERISYFVCNEQIVDKVVNKINGKNSFDINLIQRQLDEIQKELKDLEQARHNCLMKFAKNIISDDEYKELKQTLDKELEACARAKEKIEKEFQKSANTNVGLNEVMKVLQNFIEIFNQVDVKEQKKLIDSVINRIEINDESEVKNIGFEFEIPNQNKANQLDRVKKNSEVNRITRNGNVVKLTAISSSIKKKLYAIKYREPSYRLRVFCDHNLITALSKRHRKSSFSLPKTIDITGFWTYNWLWMGQPPRMIS